MKHRRTRSIVQIAALLLLVSGLKPSATHASSVTVDGTVNQIAVAAHDASVDEVLGEIGRVQGFAVERASGEPGFAISGRFSGTIGDVMATILQNESYLIEHSSVATAGIVRIVLLGPAGTAPAAAVAAAPNLVAAAATRSAVPSPQPLPREVIAPSAPLSSPPVAPLRQVAKPTRSTFQ